MTTLLSGSDRSYVNKDGHSGILLYDDVNNRLRHALLDPSTGALIRMSHQHHELHDGNSYYAFVNATINITNTLSIAFTTPNTTTEQHLIVECRTTDDATFYYYTGVTSYTGGTAFTPRNRNARSAKVSTCGVKTGYTGSTPLVLTGGTIAFQEIVTTNKGVQWERQSGEEIILPKNSIEVFRVVAGANGMTISLLANWYEHVPI